MDLTDWVLISSRVIVTGKKGGKPVVPEIMIPLVGFAAELKHQLNVVHRVAKEEIAAAKSKMKYLVGTMIEIPRGALTADEIAEDAEFFLSDGCESGIGQVDSVEIDGRTVRGTATFVRQCSPLNGGEVETVTGTFEATCGEKRLS